MSDALEVLTEALGEGSARWALQALERHGYQIVPREPTPEMYAAADREWNRNTLVVVWQLIYKAMLAAAPKPPSPQAHTASP